MLFSFRDENVCEYERWVGRRQSIASQLFRARVLVPMRSFLTAGYQRSDSQQLEVAKAPVQDRGIQRAGVNQPSRPLTVRSRSRTDRALAR